MARSDWLTGQPLEREGPNPIAGFLAGLMQAQAAKQQREAEERKAQQEWALRQIQDGRTMLEKAAQMDPALWGDEGFMGAWKTGQVEYLAASGWKPPASPKAYNDLNVGGGTIVRLDPETGEYKTVYTAPQKEVPDKPVTLSEGGVLVDPKTGKVLYKNPKTYRPDGGDKPQRVRWGVRNIQMPDGKVHVVQYDMDDAANKAKWVDLGLAGTPSSNNPNGNPIAFWMDFPPPPGPKPPVGGDVDDMDDDDKELLEALLGIKNQ